MDKKISKVTSPEKITASNNVSEINISKSSKGPNDRHWTTISTSTKIVEQLGPVASKSTALPKKSRLREKGDCSESKSSSHTKYYKQNRYAHEVYDRITSDQYLGISSSISGTSDTFQCDHPEGRTLSEKTLLKRNLVKAIDPIPISEYYCYSL